MATVQKSGKGKKVAAVGIINASAKQRSKWATDAWKQKDLRARLTQVLRDNAERRKLQAAVGRGEKLTKADAKRLKVLTAPKKAA